MAANAPSLGLIGRRMFGVPQRPDNVTPEMNTVAERIIQLYALVRRESKAPGEIDGIWITDQVNSTLKQFDNFRRTHERIPSDDLASLVELFRSHFDKPEDWALIQNWISLCGYNLTLIEGKVSLVVATPVIG